MKDFVFQTIPVEDLVTNRGQIQGLPRNPRFIRNKRYEALKQSIKDFPKMLGLRELIVYPWDGRFVIIAGNMRFLACRDLDHKVMHCKVLPEETPVAELAEIAIKDNIEFGEDDTDILANEWTDFDLLRYGMELPGLDGEPPAEFEPVTDPALTTTKVTENQVAKTRAELESHFKDGYPPDGTLEVICPHCTEIFYINP